MNIRPLAVPGAVVAIGISTGLGAIVVSAQGPPPPSTPPPPARGPLVEFAPSWSRQEEFPAGRWQYSGAMAGAAAVVPDLGEPGLSFRYVETFGVTEEAYSGDMAHLNGPTGLFIDGSDNLFVAEWSGARALKYDATGTGLLTIGKAGFHNAQDYSFENPAGISVDSSGRIWVVDESPDRVTYYDSSGVFQGEVGVRWESGTGIDRLNAPRDAAFDSSGKLYIADTQNHRVQVFDFVGGSPVYSDTIGVSGVSGTDSQHFSYPTQLAFDSIGRLYVLDRANWRIQRCEFATGWVCSTFFGETGVSGNDLSHLGLAFGIGIDSNDNVFIADSGNHRVLKCDTTGTCAHFAGTTGELGSDNSHFAWPTDAEVDTTGNVLVADAVNHRIQKFGSSGNYIATVGVTGVPYAVDTLRYNSPFGIAIDSNGSMYLAEDWGFRLIKLDSEGDQVWTVGEAGVYGSDDSHFGSFWAGPRGNLGVDSQGRVYVTDTANHRVQIFNSNGVLVGTLGTYGTGNYGFDCPAGVAISPINDDIYVVDQCNQRVQVFNINRIYKDTVGVTDTIGSDNNHFNNPRGIAVDDAGNVYVADTDNHRVQVFNSSHNYVRTLGVSGECGDDFAHFCYPHGVAVDSERRTYVASGWSNHRVQVFDSNGAYLATIGGEWGAGTGEMRTPKGVAIDQDDNVYVTEYQNQRIQKYAPGYPDWVQANINGFGRRDQSLPSLEVFGDQIYAGTWNFFGGTAQVWRSPDGRSWSDFSPSWPADNSTVFDMQPFGLQLYVATANDLGGQLWRTDGSAWEQIAGDGYGDSNNFAVNALAVFGNDIYAATSNDVTGTEIWRSTTGNAGDWAQVNVDGFGAAGTGRDVALDVFGGKLYVGLSRNGVAELWRSSNGTDWNPMFQNGLGNSDNTSVSSMEVFQGEFYIGMRNITSGGQVWRSSNGSDWTLVFSGGLGNSDNGRPYGLIAHGSYLYVVLSNMETGSEVWRSAGGNGWEQVAEGGWGDGKNRTADYFDKGGVIFDGSLYIGASNWANGAQIWRLLTEFHQIYLPLVTRE